jgi:crotonobetainyl-CoA:carnitine CoA-transferase CaiB-like acyl-CoA transferase
VTALAGVTVLDLSRLLPGGFATMVLADLGADVVKVEQPGTGDGVRHEPPVSECGDGALHLLLNRGKRSVTCDLRTEDGRDLLLRLAGQADVLVESFRPGTLARWGLGDDELAAANPRLVRVALTGYGDAHPRAAEAGHDLNFVAVAGLLSLSGDASGPHLPGVQVADLAGGLWAVVAVLAALRERGATGRGQRLELSLTEAALSTTAIPAAALAVDGRVPGAGTEWFNGARPSYGVYACADGRHVAVGSLERVFFTRLCAALGEPDLADLYGDPGRADEVRDRLSVRFRSRTRDEWARHLAEADACVTPVLDLAEAMAQSTSVGPVRLPGGGTMSQVGLPFRTAGSDPGSGAPQPVRPAPGLGEHTAEVLAGLGLDEVAVAAMRERGSL